MLDVPIEEPDARRRHPHRFCSTAGEDQSGAAGEAISQLVPWTETCQLGNHYPTGMGEYGDALMVDNGRVEPGLRRERREICCGLEDCVTRHGITARRRDGIVHITEMKLH